MPVIDSTASMATLLPDWYAHASLWLLCLMISTVRFQVALLLIPLFNKAVVPTLIRTAIGIVLAVPVVLPLHAALSGSDPAPLEIAFIVFKEALLGLMIGYAVAVLFWAIEAVGFLIDNQRGASIASTLNPLTGNDTSPLGIMFNQAFLVFFMVGGGFLLLLGLLYDSFQLWPILSQLPMLTSEGVPVFAALFDKVIRLSLTLSAPVIVAMLLAEIGLAMVSRFAPQLQVFFLAMPIKSALAFLVLVLYLPTLFSYISDEIGRLSTLPELLSQGLR